ncbi:YIP1 family protein [Actibacterium ureilyticum]|uniref:YIP1 family protein n=1 Tax=Actibacterium ureilyticum TaxID=1590614 RepID=UPI000BAB090C|nr:YIP1 family protein [Actibacterium ureilyticum]
MAVTTDIFRSWRAPRDVLRRRLQGGVREDRALAILMAACALVFVAQLPRLARLAHLSDEIPLQALLSGALLGWVFLAPLFFYALAAVSHLIARALGGRGSWFGARLALFWALLAASPVWLFQGLVAGFIGPGVVLSAVSGLLAVLLLYIWLSGLREAEGFGRTASTA